MKKVSLPGFMPESELLCLGSGVLLVFSCSLVYSSQYAKIMRIVVMS